MFSKGPHFSVKKRGGVFVVFQSIATRIIVLGKYNPNLEPLTHFKRVNLTRE